MALGVLPFLACVFDTSPHPFSARIQSITQVAEDSLTTTYAVVYSGESDLDSTCVTIGTMRCIGLASQDICANTITTDKEWSTCNGRGFLPRGIFKDSLMFRIGKTRQDQYLRLELHEGKPFFQNPIRRYYEWIKL